MRVTPPVEITSLKLTSSTAPDTATYDPPEYVGATAYGFGAIAKVAADYAIYESMIVGAASNTGNTPNVNPWAWRVIGVTETAYNSGTTYAIGNTCSGNNRCYESLTAGNVDNDLPVLPETQTAHWIDVGPTNRYAMFDLSRNTQTVLASPLTVVITPGRRINTVGLAGLYANQVQISATSATALAQTGNANCYPNAYTASATGIFDLNARIALDGYQYCFAPFSTLPSMVVFDIPPYSDIVITVVITGTSGNVKCGALVVGTYVYLGDAIDTANSPGLNFSTVTRDLYGNATLVPRRTLPQLNATTSINSIRVNEVLAARVVLNAVPALYTLVDDETSGFFGMGTILGIYKQLEPSNIPGVADKARVTIQLEEI